MKLYVPLLAVLLWPFHSFAADLSSDSLAGQWTFTHMILDGERERSVNRLIRFQSDGEVLNFDAAGQESSRAAFAVENGVIIYTDQRGAQRWKVKAFSGDKLHVDHSGAEMFFTRQ